MPIMFPEGMRDAAPRSASAGKRPVAFRHERTPAICGVLPQARGGGYARERGT
jgi:hypothetical protein